MPCLPVVCENVVIGSRLHEAVVILGLEMMRLEPQIELAGKGSHAWEYEPQSEEDR